VAGSLNLGFLTLPGFIPEVTIILGQGEENVKISSGASINELFYPEVNKIFPKFAFDGKNASILGVNPSGIL
jgi:hypothetical protein